MGQRETVIGSQLWWNWEVDTKRYWGWRQLTKDLGAHHIKVMTYCNPCLAPVHFFLHSLMQTLYHLCNNPDVAGGLLYVPWCGYGGYWQAKHYGVHPNSHITRVWLLMCNLCVVTSTSLLKAFCG